MSRAKEARQEIMESGSPVSKHSMNQRQIKQELDAKGKVFGNPNSKEAKAERRKEQARQFNDGTLPRQQFDRCLSHLINGKLTLEETSYVLRHIGEYELPINGVDGTEITILESTKVESESLK